MNNNKGLIHFLVCEEHVGVVGEPERCPEQAGDHFEHLHAWGGILGRSQGRGGLLGRDLGRGGLGLLVAGRGGVGAARGWRG